MEKIWYDQYNHDYMEMSLSINDLEKYVDRQITAFFPDNDEGGVNNSRALQEALDRTENCFKHIKTRSWYKDNTLFFNHLHGDQYAAFLYYYANSLWKSEGELTVCSKLMYLNKLLNGVFVSYKCKLPDIFEFVHPLGSIIGNATYHDYLVVCQSVTINTYKDEHSIEGNIPKLGKAVFLGAGSKIIGGKPIGNRVSVGVDATVYDKAIPDDYVVVNEAGDTVIRQRNVDVCMAQRYFYDDLEMCR